MAQINDRRVSKIRSITSLEYMINEELGKEHLYEKYCGYLTVEQIFTTDSIFLAAKKASSGFMSRPDTVRYMKEAWPNSKKLCDDVLSGKFRPKYYKEIQIIERGKARTIKPPTFETKVVQKVICDYIIRPLLEPKMITTSYASIRERGTDKMYSDVLKGVNKYYREGYKYIVKTDYKSYFASIDINILFEEVIGRYIHDKRLVEFSRSFSPEERGLSLGNELSQIPASYFPSGFDHYIKDKCGIKPYWRFMDDGLVLLKTKEDADEYIKQFRIHAEERNLMVSDEKIQVLKMGQDFIFCKERYLFDKKRKRYYRNSNPNLVRNETKKLKAGLNGKYPTDKLLMQYTGVRGSLAKRPDLKRQINKLDRLANEVRKLEEEKNNGSKEQTSQ